MNARGASSLEFREGIRGLFLGPTNFANFSNGLPRLFLGPRIMRISLMGIRVLELYSKSFVSNFWSAVYFEG